MKVGDMVRQAPNIFADREIGGTKMLVIHVEDPPPTVTHGYRGVLVTVFVNGGTRRWHEQELEIVK